MKSLRYGTILLFSLVLICQGCGQGRVETPSPQAQQTEKMLADLQTQLTQARQDVAQQQSRNAELIERIQTLMDKLAQREQEAARSSAVDLSKRAPRQAAPSERELTDAGKVGLMGAKAMAEYKAAQLSKRLDKLSKDLDGKEQELAKIKGNAEQKEREVTVLTQKMQQIESTAKAKTEEMQARLEKIGSELATRSAEAQRFKQGLDESDAMLKTLKTAVADASKLKSNAEKELERLGAELAATKKQLEETRGSLEQYHQAFTQLQAQQQQTVQDLQAWKLEADKARAETTQIREEAETLRGTSETLKEEGEQFRSQAVRSQEEAEQFKLEAARNQNEAVKLRAEVQRSQKELEEIKAHAEQLSARVQELETPPPAPPEAQAPSSVDHIIGGPSAEEEEELSGPASGIIPEVAPVIPKPPEKKPKGGKAKPKKPLGSDMF